MAVVTATSTVTQIIAYGNSGTVGVGEGVVPEELAVVVGLEVGAEVGLGVVVAVTDAVTTAAVDFAESRLNCQ